MRLPSVLWTPGAARDLEQIHAYIAADSPRYADVVAIRIVQAFDRVANYPQAGRVVPEIGRDDVRELIQGAYRLVYRLREDRAEVLTIHHGARRFPDLHLTE